MKKTSNILLAGAIAGWFATTARAQDAAPQTPQPATIGTNANPAPIVANPNAKLTAGTADEGLTLNLRGATIDKVLAFLSESAGFTINRQTSTISPGTVDVVSATPLNKDEIVQLINQVLADHNLTALRNGRTLTIETIDQAYGDSPIKVLTDLTNLPQDEEVVTEVIPVHSLNPTQIIKDLYTLIPRGAQMNSSESGNAVVMTSTQSAIHRFAELIKALDSTGNGDLEVFLLTYADSKSIAQEIKDVFSADGGGGGGGAAANPFAAFMGRRGGGGGFGGAAAAGGDEANKTRAAVHVNAVSDDQNNAVLISAPADFMDGISNIIAKLDIPQEDSVQIRYFPLRNADCTDVANELTQLFPDPNTQANQNQGSGRRAGAQFAGGFGGGFGGRAGGGGGGGGGASMSDRLKKQVTVVAVPDPRTQSVLVTASKDTMNEIAKIIDQMDANPAGQVHVFVYFPKKANPLDLSGPLTDLFGQSGKSTTTTSQQNPFYMRQTQAAQQQQMTQSSSMGVGGGGGGGTTR